MIFVVSNPFLYKNTLANIEVFRRLSILVANRREFLPEVALYTIPERLDAFSIYAVGSLSNLFGKRFLGIDKLLIGLGIVVLLVKLIQGWRQKILTTTIVSSSILFWCLITGLGILWWTPLAWGRYYVPWIPSAAILEATAIAFLITQPIQIFLAYVRKADTEYSQSNTVTTGATKKV